MRLSLLIMILIVTRLTLATDVPDWVTSPPIEDTTHKYYVGRSDAAASESAAYKEAFDDACQAAIRENFGFDAKIESDSFSSSTNSQTLKRIREVSRGVRLNGFERAATFATKSDLAEFHVRVLYRYSKAAIRAEQERLTALADQPTELELSEIGASGASELSTVLEVITDPPGAKIVIDGEPLAVTPARLNGVIKPGPHRLYLDHPAFRPVSEEILVLEGVKKLVQKNLEPATGTLQLITEPPRAEVLINGKRSGVTPLTLEKVRAEEPLTIEFFHPRSLPLKITDLTVSRDDVVIKTVILQSRPAQLFVNVSPRDAEVVIDGQIRDMKYRNSFRLPPGTHQLEICKPGFRCFNETLELLGGENRTLTVTLKKDITADDTETERGAQTHRRKDKTGANMNATPNHLILSVSLWGRGPTLKGVPLDTATLSIGFESVWWELLLFGADLGTTAGEAPAQEDASADQPRFGIESATTTRAWLHLVPYANENSLFSIGPEITHLRASYYLQDHGEKRIGPELEQFGIGGSAAWTLVTPSGLSYSFRAGQAKFTDLRGLKGVNAWSFTVGVGIVIDFLEGH